MYETKQAKLEIDTTPTTEGGVLPSNLPKEAVGTVSTLIAKDKIYITVEESLLTHIFKWAIGKLNSFIDYKGPKDPRDFQ